MKFLPQNTANYFSSVVLALLLSQVAICFTDGIVPSVNHTSQPIPISTISSTNSTITRANVAKNESVDLLTKQRTDVLSPDLPGTSTVQANSTHIIPNKTEESQEHSINKTALPKPSSLNPVTESSSSNSTPRVVSDTSSPTQDNHSTSAAPTVPVHRKSKPEDTHIDDINRDSGPTTDYVVPLVVAMLAVPLVGVLCALLYMKGRDFWERRHYGRIDFLWDSRNDSRMDFLIDGMYNN